MFTEPNQYSRNLKIISVFFILYWLLGLTPSDESLRLLVMDYHINNIGALRPVTYTILLYFAWRFYLNSRRRVRFGYRKVFELQQYNNISSNQLKEKLIALSQQQYINSHIIDHQNWREQKNKDNPNREFNYEKYEIIIISLKYENNSLQLTYRVDYEGDRVENSRTYYRKIEWYRFPLYRLRCFFKFLVGSEDSADFFLPWLLFTMAVLTCLLSEAGISINATDWQPNGIISCTNIHSTL